MSLQEKRAMAESKIREKYNEFDLPEKKALAQAKMKEKYEQLPEVPPAIVDIGLGKVGDNSHPIHPATVHLPIAFLMAASVFDVLAYITFSSPATFHPFMKFYHGNFYGSNSTIHMIQTFSLFSYASTIAALFTALPAITSGLFEAYAMISANGLDFSNPIIKTTLIHAGVNDLAVLGALYNWLSKRGAEDFVPGGSNVVVSSVILAAVGYAAFLGGGLVYEHGVGVQRMGHGKAEKEGRVIEQGNGSEVADKDVEEQVKKLLSS